MANFDLSPMELTCRDGILSPLARMAYEQEDVFEAADDQSYDCVYRSHRASGAYGAS